MSTYPIVTVNGLSTTDVQDRWGMDPSSPPRVTSVPTFGTARSTMGGALWGAKVSLQPQLFTLVLIVAGRGTTIDDRYADVEKSCTIWHTMVGHLGKTRLSWKISATEERTAQARGRSMEVSRLSLDSARITLVFEIPDGIWTGPTIWTTSEKTNFVVGQVLDLGTTAADSAAVLGNAPMFDCVLRFKGPAANPVLKDMGSGDVVGLNRTLTAAEYWYFRASSMQSLITASSNAWTLDFSSSTIVAQVATATGAIGSAFRIAPYYVSQTSGALPVYRIANNMTATGTMTTATSLAVRYTPAWL